MLDDILLRYIRKSWNTPGHDWRYMWSSSIKTQASNTYSKVAILLMYYECGLYKIRETMSSMLVPWGVHEQPPTPSCSLVAIYSLWYRYCRAFWKATDRKYKYILALKMGWSHPISWFHKADDLGVYQKPCHIQFSIPNTTTTDNGQPFKSTVLNKLYA